MQNPPCKLCLRERMLPLKLIRSLVSPETNPLLLPQTKLFFTHNNLHENLDEDNLHSNKSRTKIPLMLFNPTQELVKDTYRLAKLAREIGMDLHPNPSLSHIIFSWPSSSSSWTLGNDAVPLPFPSLSTASMSHLRLFVNLSRGFFKLVFLKNNHSPVEKMESLSKNNNWDCTSISLFSRISGERIESMDGFSKALLAMGWTLFKTSGNKCRVFVDYVDKPVYLYTKLGFNRIIMKVRNENGDSEKCCRVRELRLPPLDFRNLSLRILQYILLMTDDVFYLA